MKTEFKVEFTQRDYLKPSQVLMITGVVLGSFALGLMPLMLTPTNNTNIPVPSEATLWAVVKEE